jgi:hypothetical protein
MFFIGGSSELGVEWTRAAANRTSQKLAIFPLPE